MSETATFEHYYCARSNEDELHRQHHDCEHGFSPVDDAGYLERLAWEIFQPGLSWRLVLQKRQSINRAFRRFDLGIVSSFGDEDIGRLMSDAGIIRHRLKIVSIIENARRMVGLRRRHGSFERWLNTFTPHDLASLSGQLTRCFKFVGPSVAREFLLGAGILPGAHHPSCPIYQSIIENHPFWLQQESTAKYA